MNPVRRFFGLLLRICARSRVLPVALAACALLAMTAAPSARADGFTYTYTGLPFDSFSPGSTCPPHCGIAATLNLPVLASQGTVEYNSIVLTDGFALLFDISISSNIGSSEVSWTSNFGMFSFSFTSDPFPSIACSAGQMEEVVMGFTNEADDFSAGECVDSSGDVERILWQDSVETGALGADRESLPQPFRSRPPCCCFRWASSALHSSAIAGTACPRRANAHPLERP